MLKLYYHPFASFCQKVLIALYEKDLPFDPVFIDLGDPQHRERLGAVWPMMKFPVLEDEAKALVLPESSVIIEYVDQQAPDTGSLIPADSLEALQVRIWDRFFDNFVAYNVTKIVVDSLRPDARNDPEGVAQAKAAISQAYDLFERQLENRDWAAGDAFSLADCAAAPALFYAGTIVPHEGHARLSAYFHRLLGRPSFRRVVDEAKPYQSLFPLEWPGAYDQY
jgi:glutathione S-transferase